MKFEGKVWRGNKNGTGFMKIPNEMRGQFNLGDRLKVRLTDFGPIMFYPKVSNYKKYLGFYIPKDVCRNNNLLKSITKVELEKIKGFTSKIGVDGKIYIPYIEIKKMDLKTNDLILIEGIINNEKVEKVCEIHSREKSNRTEYFCIFSREYRNEKGIFRIIKRLERTHLPSIPHSLLKGFNYGILDKERIIIFYTNKTPLIINSNFLKMDKLLYYLGCYFADGTKRGNSWSITASTFDQALFYLNLHRKIILNSKITTYISITSRIPVDKDFLKKLWEEKCDIKINKIRERFSDKKSLKINKYGSLVILEENQAVLKFYNLLLRHFIQRINKEKNRTMAVEFILGILEGDGSPSANSRGHIIISTNKNDVKTLEKILKISGLHYSVERNLNKISIRINSLSILKNIEILQNKIFKFYPKRKRKFIERFCQVGAVKFILGKQDYCSSWVKAWLKNEGILNKEYQLTQKGLKIKSCLSRMINEVK